MAFFQLLTDLNDGTPPSVQELHWIIKTTDKRFFSCVTFDSTCQPTGPPTFVTFGKHPKSSHFFVVESLVRPGKPETATQQRRAWGSNIWRAYLNPKGKVYCMQDGVLTNSINKAEVMFAISLWYSVLDEPQKDGSSCVIC
eukprot:8552936-Pyramimonas_sp.AAC.1